jgi:hypothetical protein
MIFDDGTNVGIGTAAPAYNLHVSGSSGPTIMVQSANNIGGQFRAKNTAGEFIKGIEGSTNGGWMDYDVINSQYITLYRTGSSGFYSIYTNGGERITVLGSNGNVGIGTTTPSFPLSFGTALGNKIAIYDIGSGTGYGFGIQSNLLQIFANDVADRVGIGYGNSTSFTETLSIKGVNVGIGLTAPTGRLHISGSTNSMLRIESQDASDTTPLVYIEGNKGGSASATAVLVELRSNIDFRGRGIHMTVSGSNSRWFAGVPYQGGAYQIGYDGSSNGLPYYYASASLFINTSGNVGIGTTTPGQKLDVNGRIRIVTDSTEIYSSANRILFRGESVDNVAQMAAYGMFLPITGQAYNLYQAGSTLLGYTDAASTLDIARGSSGAVVYVRLNSNGNSYLNGGNVGIGTTSPAYKLEVTGDIKITSTLKFGGVSVIDNTSTDVYANIRVIRSFSTLNDGMYINYNSTGTTDAHIRFFANGITERMRIDASNGNVGIGTTAPNQKLDVIGRLKFRSDTSTSAGIWLTGNNGSEDVFAGLQGTTSTDAFGVYSGAGWRFTILNGGNVGIGTQTPSSLLHVANTDARGVIIGSTTGSIGTVQLVGGSVVSPVAGRLIFGTDNTGYQFRIAKNAAGSITDLFSIQDSTGTLTVSGDLVAYGSPSDITLKTNIKPLTGSLDKVIKLQGVSFTWKEDTEISKMTGIKDDIGFIAQEVKEILPELVRENKNGLFSLRDKSITALLVEAIKEQQKQIEDLQKQINYLIENKQ